jgi:hypothetical protein
MLRLYEGCVEFEGGEVQFFWVGEETHELGTLVSASSSSGNGNGSALEQQQRRRNNDREAGLDSVVRMGSWCNNVTQIDKAAVGIYRRKRFDVWSLIYRGKEVNKWRGGAVRRIVFECERDQDNVAGEEGSRDQLVEPAIVEEEHGAEDGDRDGAGNGQGNKDNVAADDDQSSPEQEPAQAHENETEGGPEPETDAGGEAESRTNNSDRTSPDRRTRASSAATVNFPAHRSPLDLVDIAVELHGTYTTRAQANRAALSTFLELAKPKNSRIEDHHHYKYEVKPGMTERFEEGGYGESNCTTPAIIEWDAPMGGVYRWEFLRLVVQVVESELRGPVDLGDMVQVVEGGNEISAQDGEVNGVGSMEATTGKRQAQPVLRTEPVVAPLTPMEDGEVVSEEE